MLSGWFIGTPQWHGAVFQVFFISPLSWGTTIGSISALDAFIHGGLMIIDLVISRLLPIFISDCEICQHPQDGLASLRTNICSSQEINTPTFVFS